VSRLAWIAVVVGLATGCTSDHSLEYTLLSDPPESVLLSDDVIEIPAGVAVAARVVPIEDDERGSQRVRFAPQRVGIIGIENVADEDRAFVLWGMEPGQSDVDVSFDGERVLRIQAVVTEPRIGAE